MPSAPLAYCSHPGGCTERVPKGRCQAHARAYEQARGSRHERGYDADWVRLRDWFMAQPENQLCVLCDEQGLTVKATDCDHIVPFRGKADPRRLDPTNLQPLCEAHNARKVWAGQASCVTGAPPSP